MGVSRLLSRVALIARYGTEGIMLQSDAGRGYGDPFAVPNALQRLAHEGLPRQERAKLAYHNPKWFYSQIRDARTPARERELVGAHR